MRCVCCNKNLSDYESTKKDTHGEYIDMCTHCDSLIDDIALQGDEDDVLPIDEDNDDHDDIMDLSIEDLESLNYQDNGQ